MDHINNTHQFVLPHPAQEVGITLETMKSVFMMRWFTARNFRQVEENAAEN